MVVETNQVSNKVILEFVAHATNSRVPVRFQSSGYAKECSIGRSVSWFAKHAIVRETEHRSRIPLANYDLEPRDTDRA